MNPRQCPNGRPALPSVENGTDKSMQSAWLCRHRFLIEKPQISSPENYPHSNPFKQSYFKKLKAYLPHPIHSPFWLLSILDIFNSWDQILLKIFLWLWRNRGTHTHTYKYTHTPNKKELSSHYTFFLSSCNYIQLHLTLSDGYTESFTKM
jgi:hypothetical protein